MTTTTESEQQQAARAHAFQTIVSSADDRRAEAFAASIAAFWRGESIDMWRAEFNFRMLSGSPFLDHDNTRPH